MMTKAGQADDYAVAKQVVFDKVSVQRGALIDALHFLAKMVESPNNSSANFGHW